MVIKEVVHEITTSFGAFLELLGSLPWDTQAIVWIVELGGICYIIKMLETIPQKVKRRMIKREVEEVMK